MFHEASKDEKSVASTHPSPGTRFWEVETWNGCCVFRLNGKWYDAAMNVVVIHRMLNYHASNVERPLCKQRVSFDRRGVSSTLKKTVTSTR
jgi:hypothetical protein